MKHVFLLVNFCEQIMESNETSPNIIDPKRREELDLIGSKEVTSSSELGAWLLVHQIHVRSDWLGPLGK